MKNGITELEKEAKINLENKIIKIIGRNQFITTILEFIGMIAIMFYLYKHYSGVDIDFIKKEFYSFYIYVYIFIIFYILQFFEFLRFLKIVIFSNWLNNVMNEEKDKECPSFSERRARRELREFFKEHNLIKEI